MPASPELLKILASYAPPPVLRYLAAHPEPVTEPHAESVFAAVMFADVSGFTTLTEHLAERGPQGAEEITLLLQTYFGRLVDIVVAHGGEVVKFAGDAMLSLWPVTPQADLSMQVLRAGHCALQIQQILHNFEAAPGLFLSLRIALDAGEVRLLQVGGELDRWEMLLTGAPMVRIGQIEHLARPGEVVIGQHAWEIIHAHAKGFPVNEQGENAVIRLQAIHKEIQTTPLRHTPVKPEMETGMRAFIPGAILQRLTAGHAGWLAELRHIAVLFINLPGIQHDMPLDVIQRDIRILQSVVYRYEGSINKISVDDKGSTLVAVWGLPPLSHEDDAELAVQAALTAYQELSQLGLKTSIGMATGRAFCGLIGNARRREYTMIGNVVNLAARLMQAAHDDIYCDQISYNAARRQFRFDVLSPILVKGKSQLVPVYRPLSKLLTAVRPQNALVGRVAERAVLIEKLQAVLHGRGRQTLLVEGEAGIGKSRLVTEMISQAETLGFGTLIGSGDVIERTTPYHVWRGVFSQVFNVEQLKHTHQEGMASPIADVQLLRMAPLLNPVLPYEVPDNQLTAQMSGQVRAENTRRLMTRLLQVMAEQKPILIVLEDAHWMDSASWTLAWEVAQQVENAILMIALRPFNGTPPDEYPLLCQLKTSQQITLQLLNNQESLELACQRLGISAFPPEIGEFILERAEGHPFYSEELAYALRDSGVIKIQNGKCRISEKVQSLDEITFPETMHGLVTSRIDKLQPEQLLTLKVASVIGRLFTFPILHDIHPIKSELPHLPEYLQALEDRQITLQTQPEPDLTYLFRHIITQEATYNLLPYTQRHQLHHAVAEWIEQHHADNLDNFYQMLAHHWEHAEQPPKAVEYLNKAGEQALRHGAYQETVSFFKKGLRIQSGHPNLLSATEQARIYRLLGNALLGLGDLKNAQNNYEKGLSLLGHAVPQHPTGLYSAIAFQGLRQIIHLIRRRRTVQSEREQQKIAETARIYSQLSEVSFIANQALQSVLGILNTLNNAEKIGPSNELILAYAGATVIAGIVPLHKLAQRYTRMAHQVAAQIDNMEGYISMQQRTAVYRLGAAEFSVAQKDLLEAAQTAKKLGDRRRLAECHAIAAMAAFYQADYPDCVEHYQNLLELAQQYQNAIQMAWGLDGLALVQLRFGKVAQALENLQLSEPHIAISHDSAQQLVHLAIRMRATLLNENFTQAENAADQLVQQVGGASPTLYSTQEGYAGPAEVYLALAEQSDQPNQRRSLLTKARKALKMQRAYARVFPLGKPRKFIWQALYAQLTGKSWQARRGWTQAARLAHILGMPYEEALAQFYLGKFSDSRDDRRNYLAAARIIFERLDCPIECGKIEALD